MLSDDEQLSCVIETVEIDAESRIKSSGRDIVAYPAVLDCYIVIPLREDAGLIDLDGGGIGDLPGDIATL